jgi:ribosomal-protein-alanine N-acetyltransferase
MGPDAQYNDRVPFTIREFIPADFDTVWRIDQDCFPPGISYSRQELKTYMRRRGSFTLVAVEGQAGEAGGFIVAEADGRGTGHVITIDVTAATRRSGVGSLLLRAAEERLRAAGCSAVELETAVDNVSALSFYKRHGYSVTRTFPRYYSNGVDALVLEKELPRDIQKRLRK